MRGEDSGIAGDSIFSGHVNMPFSTLPSFMEFKD
jgi:hypothetical protein